MRPGQLFRRKLFLFSLLNAPVSMLIAVPLLRHAGFALPGLIQFAGHFLLPVLLLYIVLFSLSLASRRFASVLAIPFFTLLQVFLFADVKIFELFRFHMNSLVINVLTTEGASDSVILGKGTLLGFALVLMLIISAEVGFYLFSFRKAGPLTGKKLASAIVLCASLIIADKALYAYGDLNNITLLTRAVKLYPFYQPFTIKRFAMKVLKMDVNREKDLDLKKAADGSLLNYPKAPLTRKKGANSPNIIIIALEGLRFDMLNPEVMPNLYRFAAQNVNFKRHYSGGNCSRFGIFSLMYGLQGSYWHSFLAERRSPVFLDELAAQGYDFKIISCTLLTFPEFRKTVFVKMPDSIEDSFPGEKAEKDNVLKNKFLDYLSQRKSSGKPFFSFLFFNTSHQPYMYPPKFEKFKPAASPEINYVKSIDKDNVLPLFNRYRNSLYYDDSLLAEIFKGLREKGLMDNSIIIITGDHGEEFFEAGAFGHANTFDDYQTRTVFVMHVPGKAHMEVERPTSHLDLVPTLMGALGYRNPVSDYSQGAPLFEDAARPYIVSAGWDEVCMIRKNDRIIFSTESYGKKFELMDNARFSPVPLSGKLLQERKAELSDQMRRMSEFYR